MISLSLLTCGSENNGGPTGWETGTGGVLFIGNSLTYTNDLPGLVEALIDSAGAGPANIACVAYAAYGLEDHWFTGEARGAIDDGDWEVVVLQQGPSATEGRPSLLEYSQLFAGEASKIGAETGLYMVWPSRARSDDFDGVSDSYATAADLVDGVLLPAGEAWREAWRQDPDLPLYGPDGFHPSLAGTYLAALVMVEQLTGCSPVGLPSAVDLPSGGFYQVGLGAERITILQEAAAEANRRFGASDWLGLEGGRCQPNASESFTRTERRGCSGSAVFSPPSDQR
jgi:hypothetical protein